MTPQDIDIIETKQSYSRIHSHRKMHRSNALSKLSTRNRLLMLRLRTKNTATLTCCVKRDAHRTI
ncbi:hypothetical protein T03_7251 [Trichinella britovi]|uniref:Uncharacterized protein n=1 Tax=Trichinella britovi TaxID=45882 RepID=A0A0V1D378_TRIBR|nr:hypothetical protein T03_7251 [Trichinella britovi]